VIFRFSRSTLCVLLILGAACRQEPLPVKETEKAAEAIPAPEWKAHRLSGYEVVQEFPHDPGAFTQGLLLLDDAWIESTGGFGTSSIRRVERQTGKVLLKRDLTADCFGEGLAELAGKIYQVTWKNRRGFVYDAKTFGLVAQFAYEGEGWGLTTDGSSLILSDGSPKLRYMDPNTFRVIREVEVRLNGKPIPMLNELEFIEGEIFANVWHTDQILRINPADGTVVGIIDLTGIAKHTIRDPEHVLNGIAYDAATGDIFVTGKSWPTIYQIRLVKRN
jgi:glutamine cyclotransferase